MKRFLVIPGLLLFAGFYALLDGESGIRAWMLLREELTQLWQRNTELEVEIQRLETTVEALESDPFAIERAIREDFGFAKAGETVLIVSPRDDVSAGADGTASAP